MGQWLIKCHEDARGARTLACCVDTHVDVRPTPRRISAQHARVRDGASSTESVLVLFWLSRVGTGSGRLRPHHGVVDFCGGTPSRKRTGLRRTSRTSMSRRRCVKGSSTRIVTSRTSGAGPAA
jgi:hypothetical protein